MANGHPGRARSRDQPSPKSDGRANPIGPSATPLSEAPRVRSHTGLRSANCLCRTSYLSTNPPTTRKQPRPPPLPSRPFSSSTARLSVARLQSWLLSTRSPTTRHRGRTPPSWRPRSPVPSSTWRATQRT